MKRTPRAPSHMWLLLDALLALGIGCFWLFGRPHLLLAREQSQMFLWNCDYLAERMAVPGGLAQYLGEFIVQFFLNPLYGACWYAVLFLAARWLSAGLLDRLFPSQDRPRHDRKPGHPCPRYLLSLLPACALWYAACQPALSMTLTVAILLTMALLRLLPLRPRPAIAVAAAVIPIGYWLLGPAVLLIALAPLRWLRNKSRRIKAIGSVAGLTLLLAACVTGCTRTIAYPLCQIARGIDYCWDGEHLGTLEEMRYDRMIRQQAWARIVAQAEQEAPASAAIGDEVQLARWQLGLIGQQELLAGLSKEALRSEVSAFILSEVYLHIGMVNMSQRAAFEAMEAIPNYNKSGRALRRLVETNLVTGQYDVALKYIAILEETLFYRAWARRMKSLAISPERIKEHPFYHGLQKAYGSSRDMFFY